LEEIIQKGLSAGKGDLRMYGFEQINLMAVFRQRNRILSSLELHSQLAIDVDIDVFAGCDGNLDIAAAVG
jgi:hypothetical protein